MSKTTILNLSSKLSSHLVSPCLTHSRLDSPCLVPRNLYSDTPLPLPLRLLLPLRLPHYYCFPLASPFASGSLPLPLLHSPCCRPSQDFHDTLSLPFPPSAAPPGAAAPSPPPLAPFLALSPSPLLTDAAADAGEHSPRNPPVGAGAAAAVGAMRGGTAGCARGASETPSSHEGASCLACICQACCSG
ncbi:unnamed protein product [Closterium sp. NIES-54]